MKSVSFFVLAASSALAWWPEAHNIICQMALRHLVDTGRQDVADLAEAVASLFPEEWPDRTTFAMSCTWLDFVGYQGENSGYIPFFVPYHFVDVPSASEPLLGPNDEVTGYSLVILDEAGFQDYIHNDTRVDILYGMTALNKALFEVPENVKPTRTFMLEHAINLRAYAHLMGDITQPLHLCGLWNGTHSCEGSNAFPIDIRSTNPPTTNIPRNYHYLWDSMCFWAQGDDLSPEAIGAKVDIIMGMHPYESLSPTYKLDLENNYEQVYRESYGLCSGFDLENLNLGERFMYEGSDDLATSILNWERPAQIIDDDFVAWCTPLSQKLVAMSAYRLAHQLVHWHDGLHADIIQLIHATAEGEDGATIPEEGSPAGASALMAASTFFIALYSLL
eukprot:Protomagalhaensia_wolfi_Nauph_80__1022@NODE_1592_length_1453_cov_469_213579_g1232_i0_p1_GENE_NODE_1592_length_1453_cov_469_213579_g1232_i0NODE_1592_length_1453_cov_469_213579_g1232_i0_p1_ORF_typecomplete_len391_score62_00S1P1_nuclease/PF02265_16/1_8e23_NODE_1592_length_1453_cov_469_213579_g1232_i01141286